MLRVARRAPRMPVSLWRLLHLCHKGKLKLVFHARRLHGICSDGRKWRQIRARFTQPFWAAVRRAVQNNQARLDYGHAQQRDKARMRTRGI